MSHDILTSVSEASRKNRWIRVDFCGLENHHKLISPDYQPSAAPLCRCQASKTHQFELSNYNMYALCQGIVPPFALWLQIRKETEVWLLVNSDDEANLTYAQEGAHWSLNRRYMKHNNNLICPQIYLYCLLYVIRC